MKSQLELWHTEADRWFERNRHKMEKNAGFQDFLLDLYSIKPQRVFEYGCANGYRLHHLQEKYGSEGWGCDLSSLAVEDGKKKFGDFFIDDNISFESFCEEFDLVMINYVFHWIDRFDLMTLVSNIDRILIPGKYMIITDFGSNNNEKIQYKHKKGIYTYKQEYDEMFTSFKTYKLIAKLRFNHDIWKFNPFFTDKDMGTICLLQKKEVYNQTQI